MTEEQKAKRREYMRNYYKNLSRYQKEKRRLKNLENKKQKYHDKTPEEKEKRKEETIALKGRRRGKRKGDEGAVPRPFFFRSMATL